MTEEFKDDDAPEHPALKGFNSTWEKAKHVVKRTAILALKGAVIGGAILGAVGFITPAAATLVTGPFAFILAPIATYFVAAPAAVAFAMKGLMAGAIAGGAIGLAQGVGEADDVAEDAQADRITQYNKARQMAMNEQTLQMGMAKTQQQLQAMQFQPPHLAGMQNNMIQKQGVGGMGAPG